MFNSCQKSSLSTARGTAATSAPELLAAALPVSQPHSFAGGATNANASFCPVALHVFPGLQHARPLHCIALHGMAWHCSLQHCTASGISPLQHCNAAVQAPQMQHGHHRETPGRALVHLQLTQVDPSSLPPGFSFLQSVAIAQCCSAQLKSCCTSLKSLSQITAAAFVLFSGEQSVCRAQDLEAMGFLPAVPAASQVSLGWSHRAAAEVGATLTLGWAQLGWGRSPPAPHMFAGGKAEGRRQGKCNAVIYSCTDATLPSCFSHIQRGFRAPAALGDHQQLREAMPTVPTPVPGDGVLGP